MQETIYHVRTNMRQSLIKSEPRYEKACFMPYVNNTGKNLSAWGVQADEHLVVRCLDSIILAKFKISRL